MDHTLRKKSVLPLVPTGRFNPRLAILTEITTHRFAGIWSFLASPYFRNVPNAPPIANTIPRPEPTKFLFAAEIICLAPRFAFIVPRITFIVGTKKFIVGALTFIAEILSSL
jgi:hypothetical protein